MSLQRGWFQMCCYWSDLRSVLTLSSTLNRCKPELHFNSHYNNRQPSRHLDFYWQLTEVSSPCWVWGHSHRQVKNKAWLMKHLQYLGSCRNLLQNQHTPIHPYTHIIKHTQGGKQHCSTQQRNKDRSCPCLRVSPRCPGNTLSQFVHVTQRFLFRNSQISFNSINYRIHI